MLTGFGNDQDWADLSDRLHAAPSMSSTTTGSVTAIESQFIFMIEILLENAGVTGWGWLASYCDENTPSGGWGASR
jgi:hypothetical protein